MKRLQKEAKRNAFLIAEEKRRKRIKNRRAKFANIRNKARRNVESRKFHQMLNQSSAYARGRCMATIIRVMRKNPKLIINALHREYGFFHNLLESFFRFQWRLASDWHIEFIKYLWHFHHILKPVIESYRYRPGYITNHQIRMPVIKHAPSDLYAKGLHPRYHSFEGVVLLGSDMILEEYTIYL